MIITNRRYRDCPAIIAVERVGDIYCRKGQTQVESDPLHIHAGLKSVASPARGATDGEKKRAEGTTKRIPIIHDAGCWRAATAIPGLFEQREGRKSARYSLISRVVCPPAEVAQVK